jgi:hypothetical protein
VQSPNGEVLMRVPVLCYIFPYLSRFELTVLVGIVGITSRLSADSMHEFHTLLLFSLAVENLHSFVIWAITTVLPKYGIEQIQQ